MINMDETNYRLVNNSHLTWPIKGKKMVMCHIDDDTKEGVTVISSITASGEKWPLMLIKKGKTDKCLKSYELSDEVWSTHSESGLSTETVILEYLDKVADKMQGPCCLIMDTFSSHRTDIVKEKARALDIELVLDTSRVYRSC